MAKTYCIAGDLADWFVRRADLESGDAMTHLKLQKLLYYAQAWHLANYNRRLFDEDLKAWTHGPVVPSVWHKYRNFGWDIIQPAKTAAKVADATASFLENVYNIYGKYSGKALEDLTHDELPWKEARGDLPIQAKSTTPISDKTMRDFYASKINKTWPTSAILK